MVELIGKLLPARRGLVSEQGGVGTGQKGLLWQGTGAKVSPRNVIFMSFTETLGKEGGSTISE